jgi:UDP:flavonoid glycosyltransferase YjiC (YdhE family)
MSRRFLITLWPFTGHLLPQLSIANALRERGHEVAFYTGEDARVTIDQAGFELFPFERIDEERARRRIRMMDAAGRRTRPRGGRMIPVMREWMVDTIPDQVADLRSVIELWRPDAIATDVSMWAPILVLWEADRVPVALSSTFMGPLIPGPDAPAFGFGLRPPRTRLGRLCTTGLTRLMDLAGTPIRRAADEVRAQYGLAPLGESVARYTARLPLYIVGNVPELDYDRHDLPPSVHYVGNCIWYPKRPGMDEWLEAIPAERPWVHVTESTVSYGEPFLLQAAIAALANEPVELIVTTGDQRDGASLGPGASAPNVHTTQWVSHGELLPRCSALISLGGNATILAAAEAGVPMVLAPTSWDKPDNARRVTETGAGVRLPARRVNPERLRTAVREVLDRPSYREAAQRLAARLAAAPGPPRAAELLEQLACADAADSRLALADSGSP